ncbi:hypothetical protein DdX_06888 [Ditylenchus destructor]|uniref:Uncharacterized protein n=1 Tax=Ditylenchus destructor TaxID=166010 RepID=A0AAD4NA61_9BILA|nr:hypothetical protein DdX_06888 [Ditylenchus destructor]
MYVGLTLVPNRKLKEAKQGKGKDRRTKIAETRTALNSGKGLRMSMCVTQAPLAIVGPLCFPCEVGKGINLRSGRPFQSTFCKPERIVWFRSAPGLGGDSRMKGGRERPSIIQPSKVKMEMGFVDNRETVAAAV